MKLDQEELQRKSEQLKEQKIKQIKDNIKSCLKVLNLPEVIENTILDYSFDESKIETNYSLKAKVKKYYNTEKEHLISELDVSCVTSMYELFCCCYKFNQSLDKWDTSNVIDMSYMFYDCYIFNQSINFDTKNVTNMESMFAFCFEFNQAVNFDTSNVVNMSWMFCGCKRFNQHVNFNTKNVNDMRDMFGKCVSLKEKNKLLTIY